MTQSALNIRPAVLADVPIIAEFNLALCRETEHRDLDPDTVQRGVTTFVSDRKRGRYFVAEKDGEVIGQSAHTYEWSDWRDGELWWIQSVYVHPDHRGQGVFRALFEHIRELGTGDPHCCGIRLYMENDNHVARQSYRKLGFEETGYEVLEHLL